MAKELADIKSKIEEARLKERANEKIFLLEVKFLKKTLSEAND